MNSDPPNLPSALLPTLPPSCHYIPNFLSAAEEAQILAQIDATPASRWTTLSHRRLLSLPSTLTGAKRDTLLASPLPTYLSTPIVARLGSLGVFAHAPHGAPNHVLVNEYRRGEGIMPHEDGPAYYACTATVSLGSHAVLEVYAKNGAVEREAGPRWRILQERGSLLVTSGEMYEATLHGIECVEVDEGLDRDGVANWEMLGDKGMFEAAGGRGERETRVSLTFRDVVKVVKLGGVGKFLGKR